MGVVSRIFRSGNSDAVRLPKEITFGPGVEVEIVRVGDVVTISPRRKSVAETLSRLRSLPKPPTVGTRPEVEIPDRTGR